MSLDYLDETSDVHVSLGAANVPAGNDQLTITAWVNAVTGTVEDQIVIAKAPNTGNTGDFRLQLEEPNNELRGIINDNELTGVGQIPSGVWTFIAMVYDGVNKTLFINAVQDATEAQTGNVGTSADPLLLGALDDGTIKRELDGLLADVRVYTRALSLAELQTMLVTLGQDGIVFGLLWRWMQRELSPGTAATVAGSIIDLAGNLNGTPVNSPVYQEGILR